MPRTPRSPFSPWQAAFKPARSPALGEIGMVGVLAYILAENHAAAAALFRVYVNAANVYDNGETKRLLETGGDTGAAISEALDMLVDRVRLDDVELAVATEIEITPKGHHNPEHTAALGRGDLSIAIKVPHRIAQRSDVRAQLIVEAKRDAAPLDRVGIGRRWTLRHRALTPYRKLFQPAAYGGVWTTYENSDERPICA